jgi:heptosyltransferase-1
MKARRILAVRLGAMGDIIHTLPAVASLKQSLPGCHLAWAVERRWTPLLDGNPFVDEILIVERGSLGALLDTRRRLRAGKFDMAVDFQGLIKSALVAAASRADRIYGLDRSIARERLAALFYSDACKPHAAHMVDRNLELAAAAGAHTSPRTFHIPPGREEGPLPARPFVLANPTAGWAGKQWPLDYYGEIAVRLRSIGYPLVLNGASPVEVPGTVPHVSGLEGLIHATRCAAAIIGVDSGPLHLAAAVGKPGVAIFGPTDPERNGPYGGTIQVLRAPGGRTTYRRRDAVSPEMRAVTPEQVWAALRPQLPGR